MRAPGHDEAVPLVPARTMDLEDALAWLDDDELVEVSPTTVRMQARAAVGRGPRGSRVHGAPA